MHYLKNAFPQDTIAILARDVLTNYKPPRTRLDMSMSAAVGDVLDVVQSQVKRELEYFGAFLFVVTDTTIETVASGGADGWHIDSSCAHINGDCFNAWVPLFVSSTRTGIQIIGEDENALVYGRLGDRGMPLEISVRRSAGDKFAKISAPPEADLMLVRPGASKGMMLSWDDLSVSTFDDPAAGDLAIFKQTEIHRGVHDDGVRIQLSLKFRDSSAKVLSREDAPRSKPLSRHGRLEAHLVRELLNFVSHGAAAR